MKDFLSDLLNLNKNEEGEVIKSTHVVTQDQLDLWAEVKLAQKALADAESAKRIAKKKFWNKVESDLNLFDSDLRMNEEKLLIEVLEDEQSNS